MLQIIVGSETSARGWGQSPGNVAMTVTYMLRRHKPASVAIFYSILLKQVRTVRLVLPPVACRRGGYREVIYDTPQANDGGGNCLIGDTG